MKKWTQIITEGPYVLGVWVLLLCIHVKISYLPYRRNRDYLAPNTFYYPHTTRKGPVLPDQKPQVSNLVERYRRRINIASRYQFRGAKTCLRKALVVRKILSFYGFGSKIVYAVLPEQMAFTSAQNFHAHAWVEIPFTDGSTIAVDTVLNHHDYVSLSHNGTQGHL